MSRSNSRGLTINDATILASKFFPTENFEVVNFDLKPFAEEKLGYLGVHELLAIEVRVCNSDTETSNKTLTFFAKSVLPTSKTFDNMIFAEESKFFCDVMPQLLENFKSEHWAAKCFLNKDNTLILEDLKSQGYKIISEPLNETQLKSALSSIARFHASSMLLEVKLQKSLGKVYPDYFNEKTFINDGSLAWSWILAGMEVVETVASNLGFDCKYIVGAYEFILGNIKTFERERNVLCHCDLWSNNMMFKEENGVTSCRLVDFQMASYTCYAVDLVEFMYLNISKDIREKKEKELIQFYHSELKKNLLCHGLNNDNIISLEDVFRDFENKRICGLVAAAQFFPIALLNKELTEEYTKDDEQLVNYMYKSRKEFVLRAMKLDNDYKCKIEEIVKEVVEYMQRRYVNV